MDIAKVKLFFVMSLAGASVIVMSLTNKGFKFTTESVSLAAIILFAVGLAVLVIKKWDMILFMRTMRKKPMEILDDATVRLCGFKKFTAYDDFIIFESESRLVGHSYIKLSKLPYMIEEMTEDRQLHITASFSRLLGTFNHPFTYMPICRPVSRTRFIKDIKSRIHNLRIAIAVAKVPDPSHQLEEKILEKQLERLTQGESPIEVVFIVQLRETGKNVDEISSKLSTYAESMINNLTVIQQVSAKRLRGFEMIESIKHFFMLEV